MKVSVQKDLAPLKIAADQEITRRAADARAVYASPDKAAIYLEKRDEAERWLASGEPEDLDGFPYLAQETGVTAPTTYQLASLWINLSALWLTQIGPAIEGAEQRAKRDVSQALKPADLDAVLANLEF
jgi:hypothetical protein